LTPHSRLLGKHGRDGSVFDLALRLRPLEAHRSFSPSVFIKALPRIETTFDEATDHVSDWQFGSTKPLPLIKERLRKGG